jgi:hypothetical protein
MENIGELHPRLSIIKSRPGAFGRLVLQTCMLLHLQGDFLCCVAQEVDQATVCSQCDVNNDGERNVSDILLILANFGMTTDGCTRANEQPGDVNGDCTVSVTDVLTSLSFFGQDCGDTAVSDAGCGITMTHRSTLLSLEADFPCQACVQPCIDAFGEPEWGDATSCAPFLPPCRRSEITVHHNYTCKL